MPESEIPGLFTVPKVTDPDGADQLRKLVTKHWQLDSMSIGPIVDTPMDEGTEIADKYYRVVASARLLPRTSYTSFYHFTANGKCVVRSQTSPPTVYDSWNDGYRRLVHDIRDY